MPGGGYTVGDGVHEKNDRIGPFVPVEAEGPDSVKGVRGGYGAWVSGRTHADTAWEGSGGETALGSHGPQRGTVDIHDGLPDCRGTS